MISEEKFINRLNGERRKVYLENQFSHRLDAVMREFLTVREYDTFSKNLEISPFPRFLDNHLQPAQKENFRKLIEDNKWTVTDAWIANTNFVNMYSVWKKRYLASRGINSAPSSSMQARQNLKMRIQFPTSEYGIIEGKKGITRQRISQYSGAELSIRKESASTSEVVISADCVPKLMTASQEVWWTLLRTMKSSETLNDLAIYKFISGWNKMDAILFHTKLKCAIIAYQTKQQCTVIVRAWTKLDKNTAIAKLRELQQKNMLPSNIYPDIIDYGNNQVKAETDEIEDLSHLPNCVNVLILGETGVGKSTFINGMVNYLKFNKMDVAEKFGPEVLVDSRFKLMGENGEAQEFIAKPKDSVKWDTNEADEIGESATQKPMSYTFALPGRKEKYIRIIDTPGIGDTRGIDQDKENFEEIMSYIADYPKIHAILFLVAPSEARLRVSFRYGIQELLARLHKTAAENVIFGFTRSRTNHFKPGESYTTLQALLKKLGEEGTPVTLDKESAYFFDSESFRYLVAKKQGFKFRDFEDRDYKESWKMAVGETQRMFKYIFTLQPHDVNETLCVNNTKKVIQMLSKPLGDITKNILNNESLLKDKKREIEQLAKEGKDLEGKRFVQQINLETEELESPRTVCTSKGCVEYGTVGGVAHTTIYKTICDPNCGHTGIQTNVVPNPKLADCKAFEKEHCKTCGCHWNTHMHIRYKTNEIVVKVLDESVLGELNKNLSKQEDAKSFIDFLQEKITEQNKNKETILQHCAEFAAFVAQNSLLAVNDAYNEYLKYLIKEEKDKYNGANSELLEKLEQYERTYTEQSNLLIEARKEKKSQQKTVDQINKMINELKESDFCGRFLEEIQYLEVVSVRASAQNRSKKILLHNWKEDLKWLMEKPKKKAKKFLGISSK